MYAIIAFACVWYYRRLIMTSTRNFVLSGLLPFVGGLFMVVIFAYGLKTQPSQVSIVAAALCLACVVVAFIARAVAGRVTYFTQGRAVHEVAGAATPEPTRG